MESVSEVEDSPDVERERGEKVKEVEGVVLVPQTPASRLKEELQAQDEILAAALKIPSLRFVERSGCMIVQDVGQSDPWSRDMYCPRDGCWHCKGRYQIHKETEELAMAKVSGDNPKTSPPQDCRLSLPGCTSEGVNYVLECGTCRDKGCKRQYWG